MYSLVLLVIVSCTHRSLMDLLCTVFKKKVARISNGLKFGGQINKRWWMCGGSKCRKELWFWLCTFINHDLSTNDWRLIILINYPFNHWCVDSIVYCRWFAVSKISCLPNSDSDGNTLLTQDISISCPGFLKCMKRYMDWTVVIGRAFFFSSL